MVPLFIGLVRVTGPFFYFGEFEQPTRRVRDAIYTPSRLSHTGLPALTLLSRSLRQ